MVRGIVRHFHAGTNCAGAKRRNAREEKVNKHGNQWQPLLNGDIPAVASWSRPTDTFYPDRKLSDATSFAGTPSCSGILEYTRIYSMPPALLGTFLLEYATTKLRRHNLREVGPTKRFFREGKQDDIKSVEHVSLLQLGFVC